MQVGNLRGAVFCGVALVVALVHGPAAARQAAAPDTVFFDDFSGPQLDRAKWNVVVTGRTVNNEQQAYVDSPETVGFVTGEASGGAEHGALAIRAIYQPGFKTAEGRAVDFISGRLDTRGKFEFAYGTAAARVKLTAGPGLWPAFWALGNGRWPDSGEMDILENVGDPAWTNFALHGPGYSGNTPLALRAPLPAGADITAWHVYAMDWTPDSLVFRVDGIEKYRVSKEMVTKYGPWAYDTPKYLIANMALGGQYPQSVNHATAPYPGLPESTVALIKGGRAAMLVDWVRVTKSATH